jgi:hypothetical protein
MAENLTSAATEATYADGRRVGLATGALATAAVAFVSLLGIEKAVLAGVLATLALRGARAGTLAQKLSAAALLLAVVYTITYVTVLIVFREQLAELLRLMQKMG